MLSSLLFSTPKLFLYFLSGVLLGIGFVIPNLWFLIFFGIFLFVFLMMEEMSWKQALLGGFIVFATKALFATSVFWSVYPITWIELDLGRLELVIIGLYWITVSIFIGLGGFFCSGGVYFLKTRLPVWFLGLVFPLIFVLGEVLGSFMFSVLTYGDGGTLNTVYSLGYVGYLLAEHQIIIQIAILGGVYILSFLVVLIGFWWWFLFKNKTRKIFNRSTFIILTILLVTAVIDLSYLSKEGKVDNKSVIIIDTFFGDEYHKLSDGEEYKQKVIREAVFSVLELKPDYLVLPEGSNYNYNNLNPESAYQMFRFESSDTDTIMIDTSSYFNNNQKSANIRATIYDGVNKKGWGVDKQYLVPQGEYMPYVYISVLKILKQEVALRELNKKLHYRPGDLNNFEEFPKEVPAILFCFESLDPYGVKRLLKNKSETPFVAHPISHAWFHESKILWHQLDTMLKIQAIWNQVPIVSAGNMTTGALYTPLGQKLIPETVADGEGWKAGLISL